MITSPRYSRQPLLYSGLFVTACLTSAAVHAQNLAPSRQAVTVVPRITVTETVTDNVRLASAGQQSEQISEVSPGIQVNIEGSRVKAHFDYAVTEVAYAQNSSARQIQNGLTSFGNIELAENFAFVDFNGTVSQQAISAFGTQSSSNVAVNANKTEVSEYRVSPNFRGRLGDFANYDARLTRDITRSDAANRSNVMSSDIGLNVSGKGAAEHLGWWVSATQQSVDYSAGRSTTADALKLGAEVSVTPQVSLSATGGHEINNLTSMERKSYGSYGAGASWSPTDTLKLSASGEHRSFGGTHSVSIDQRTARTAWKFSDVRQVSIDPSQAGAASLGPVYDLLFGQFAAVEPDLALRAQLVNAFMQANGIPRDTTAVSSFLTSAVSLLRRQDFLFSLLGIRDTITFIATRTATSRVDTLSTATDDLSTLSTVRQRGVTVNYTHRLTPETSASVLASQQISSSAAAAQGTRLRSIVANLSSKVGRKTTVSVGARRTVATGIAPYAESAITGNLNLSF
jgi:uncharacterized protein (PEP-CTERM system associated)